MRSDRYDDIIALLSTLLCIAIAIALRNMGEEAN